jgi:hypothetical protein
LRIERQTGRRLTARLLSPSPRASVPRSDNPQSEIRIPQSPVARLFH